VAGRPERRRAMTEEIEVYHQDMETYLEPEEYQAFLKARQKVEEYSERYRDYKIKKSNDEWARDECQKRRDGAKSDEGRLIWDIERADFMLQALMPAPYKPDHYFNENDRFIELVRERKAEKARQEIEKKRRLAVLEEMDPPLADAKKYLTPEETQRFLDSIPGAIDAYLDRDKRAESYSPGIWFLTSKASDYSYWILIIKERKEGETRSKQAQLEHDQYLDKLSLEVDKFKAELGKSKKPKFAYPSELKKYEPDSWCEIYPPNKEQIQNWAEGKILEVLPEILADLTRWELTREVRVMPRAVYKGVNSIPCLTWYFETHLLVTANLELKKCVIRKRYPAGYTVEVQGEGEKLGVLYLEQPEWLTPGSFTTPIALLSLLAKGDLEAPGIAVTEHGFPSTTFAIQGFEEEVEVYDDFRKFIKDIAKDKPLAEALLAKGLIDGDTAKLLEEKAALPLPKVPGAGQTFSDNSDVIAVLESMGYKKEEIKGMLENAKLSPEMSLEEKVETVLKFLGSNSL